MSLSQIELVWVRVRVEWECFWVNLREDNKVSESKMAVSESNMAEFKMAAIIKLSQNEWVKFFCANGWIQDGRIQDGCHHQVESEWMSEVFFVQMVGTNLGKCEWVWEEKLRMAESKMAKFKMAEFKMAAIIKLSQIEWVKSFLMAIQDGKSKMAEFKMAAIIKLVRMNEFESDWISLSQSQSGVRVFLSESERR